MKRSLVVPVCLAVAGVAAPGLAQQPARPGPPALPGAGPDDAPPAAAAAPGLLTPQQLYEHVRRGVVAIEHNGVPMAIGTVLGGDGRILTALSGLGGAEGADVRYADGTTVHARVGHADKDSDLALLVPQAGKWTDGLSASEGDPGPSVHAMLPGRGAHLGPTDAAVKGQVDAHARDGTSLLHMLDVDLKAMPIAGAPLLDATGNVVGVLVRACKGPISVPLQRSVDSAWSGWGGTNGPAPVTPGAPGTPGVTPKAACTPIVLGEPVTAIRSFLSRTPATAVAPAPWLGIRGEAATQGATRGVKVTAVAPQSPAEKVALRPNADVIVAVDGQPVDSPERLAVAIGKHAPGDAVKLLVFGDSRFREVPVVLRAAP